MKQEHINEIKGIIVLALGLILLASFVSYVPDDLSWFSAQPNQTAANLIRIVGAYAAGTLFFLFGHSAYFLIVILFFWSWNKFASREIHFTLAKFLSVLVLFAVISSLFSMIVSQVSTARFDGGGLIGYVSADFLVRYLGRTGAYIVLFTLGTLTLVLTGEFLVSPIFLRLFELGRATLEDVKVGWEDRKMGSAHPGGKSSSKLLDKIREERQLFNQITGQATKKQGFENRAQENIDENFDEKGYEDGSGKPNIRIAKTEKQNAALIKKEPKKVGEYRLPGLDLLDVPPEVSSSQITNDLQFGARTLEETLMDFGVDARVADIERGPVITRYELEPAPGVKIQKITTLSDDIALAMRAAAVRIVAPIPGKNRVGIEVPNNSTAAVLLREVLCHPDFQNAESKVTLAIGKDISGIPIIVDLAEMPHLLIAGTTGAGKTVCVNTLIMSILFNASPSEVKFLMIDPKMVELAQYSGIPHMLCPPVTDAKKVTGALNWVVGEMESRYSQLSKAGVRNIQAYHKKGSEMPYIVVVIDEFADLMQTAAKTIESAVTRLAQLSRAVGIHLVLATQRPSVNVITGVIKANFPSRISFKVASKVDSRTVLDTNGAETLLGKGDLLFMRPGDAKPIRGQCSFMSDEEVRRVIDFIKSQGEPEYDDMMIKNQSASASGGTEQKDELYDEAVRLVIETNQASVSILQRRMRLGYTRAARLIDMMEQNGLVGPYCGSKPRDILVDREEWLLKDMNQEGKEKENGTT